MRTRRAFEVIGYADKPATLPPLSAAPEAIAELYAHCFGSRGARTPTAFARSVLAVINAIVAYDFEIPRDVLANQLARRSETRDTLYDVFADLDHDDLVALIARTRATTFGDFTEAAEPFIWTFPVHLHLVRPHPNAHFIAPDDPALLPELARFDPAAARAYHSDPAGFARHHARSFVEWRAARNLERLNRDFGPEGAEVAIEQLQTHFAPYNDFYETCIERVGCPGFRFRLDGVSEVFTSERVGMTESGWLNTIVPDARALNLVAPAPACAIPRVDEFALFPQGAFSGTEWRVSMQQSALGLMVVPASCLGHIQGPERLFDKESGVALTHEMGHIFQLQHLGCETLHPQHEGSDDFDYPSIGVASDTLWRKPRLFLASIRPDDLAFAHSLHSRSMFMNFMSVSPPLDDALFFTRAQAARARLFARIHYADRFERAESWSESARWVGCRDMSPEALRAARFDAPLLPIVQK